MPPAAEVYLLPLNDDGSPDVPGGYIYLTPQDDQPVVVRFAIEGTSSICRHGSLWVNIPEAGADFHRDQFREIRLKPDFNRTIEITIPIHQPGAYAFYTTYSTLPNLVDATPSEKAQTPVYYIDVAPRLTLAGERLPLMSLSIFSILSKFMGSFPSDWENHLRGISERGYNMIHYTPLQARGASNSPYSIFDQLAWDPTSFPNGEDDVVQLVQMMDKHNLLGLTDVVWNHTANNSEWLQDHPDAGYNVSTAPWIEAALVLDTALVEFGANLTNYGLPNEVNSLTDLIQIMNGVKERVVLGNKLWQYYVVDVERNVDDCLDAWAAGKADFSVESTTNADFLKNGSLEDRIEWVRKAAMLGTDQMGARYRRRVNPVIAAAILTTVFGENASKDHKAARDYVAQLADGLNVAYYQEYDADAAEILEQIYNRVKYLRLDENGPKQGPFNDAYPFVESYFTRLPQNERTAKHKQEDLALINNGWIWAANALVDNAGPASKAYLRREVIVWGDCVKLRYGNGPKDSPFLWEYMTKYTCLMAKYFTGFRIDNAHSTPLPVAEYLLDAARKVRPNLFVVAELFTGSEEMDYVFVKRLGISALIREAMQAWNTAELSRLVHRHGGRPIGSFEVDEVRAHKSVNGVNGVNGANGHANGESDHYIVRRIKHTPVHALFMDCTHDNEVPAQKRDARDTLPNAALVAMCASSVGSVMGYDEIYPTIVDLVNETRQYTSISSSETVQEGGGEGGIGGIKKLLNRIHTQMGNDGYDETHIHHEDQYISVHRVHPKTRKGYFLIAHTAFPGYGDGSGPFSAVHLGGSKANYIGSWMLEVDVSDSAKDKVTSDENYLRGLPSRVTKLSSIRVDDHGSETVITATDKFPPGSIALFETWIPEAEPTIDQYVTTGAEEAFSKTGLEDLNFILYRCEAEEMDFSGGEDGVYDVPGHGKLVYAGLQGWWSVLKHIIRTNDLGHALCQHLRSGQWALDYILARLDKIATQFPSLQAATTWLRERFDAVRKLPNFLLPRYFALVVQTAYTAATERGISLMNENVRNGQWFLKSLALVSIQQTGYTKSASLFPNKSLPSLAAGLPHFAVEWARCWGRDVFISLRGLYLGTGRYDEARQHIVAFASVLKHGMIPNLLSSGNLPRYNSRDSIWFFLQTIQDYTKIVPNGMGILHEKVPRRFLPYDDTWFPSDDPRAYSQTCTLEDIIQEAVQRHASGMSFREANAGPDLDMQMKSDGFNIEIHVDWKTGIIFGGNQNNCGTWQDKMGESEKAGSKGVPGTPRDGAAVEITGLVYSTLRWLDSLHDQNQYKYGGVTTDQETNITFGDWAAKIKDSFERCYYIPLDAADDHRYDVDSKIVNRRGIYKDLYKSGKEYEDYQLRSNFPIAMCVAPELFDDEHAMNALLLADRVLRGPTGMATLDPSDLNYRPYYNNSEDSTDFHTSKGRNYHQGPEWLWPTGFFLRALLHFDLKRRADPASKTEAFQQITQRLAGCKQAILDSPWAGLTELTNKGGEHCGDSSPTQAWSAGCLIDLYHDAAQYDVSQLIE